jgi:uncharacterized repeat protein (TIGR03803 family)
LTAIGQPVQLWGVCREGGLYNGGTLFSLDSEGGAFKNHYSFKADAGFTPLYSHFIMGGDGYLYGLTSEGGKYSDGVLFRINLAMIILKGFMNCRITLTFSC